MSAPRTDEVDRDAVALATYLDADRPRGDREDAFRELVDRHSHRLHAVCLRVLGSHADAEEAVQETFVRLARSGDDFRGDAALSTWLFRVARNVCTDRVRYEARRPHTPVADIADVHDPVGDDGPAASAALAEADAVGRALARLDERARVSLLLVAVDGLSYAEVAEATGVAVGTVKSRVSRARVELADLLAEEDEPADAAAPETEEPHDVGPGSDASARGPP